MDGVNMAAEEILLTREGRKELEKELEWRLNDHKEEIAQQLREARGFGDLSENAEYDAAREAQAQNESRISELNHILTVARDADQVVASNGALVAAVGTEVDVEDAGGKRSTFSIVGTTETNSLLNMISNESPLGAAIVGHVVGDDISFTTPSGRVREYTIRDIRIKA